MPITLAMPALSPTMEEGTLARWLVKAGDPVAAGDLIAEIETDKATLEFESPVAGVLARILVPEGTAHVAVASAIALLAEEGEDPALVGAAGPAAEAAPAASAPLSAPVAAAPAAGRRLWASPLARRIAVQAGLDLANLAGTGPGGRIVRQDVETALAARAAAPAAVPIAPAAPAVAALPTAATTAPAGPYPEGSYEVIELDGMRRTIASRLTQSKQTVPHFYLRSDVALDAMLALRDQLNAAAPKDRDGAPAWKISVNDILIKALAGALGEVPDANVTWAGDRILRHRAVDVAVAVALEGGLITPVIRNAGALSLSAISAAMRDLAARARARKLLPGEYQGGTTSLSNLGMFGVSSFDAVINPPHGTILAVGAAERRVVPGAEGVAIATMMTATLSVDHRAVDGALGARLLAAFRRLVEAPLTLLA